MSSSGSVRLRYEICLEAWGNANGNMHGKGTFTWTNGSQYTGDFLKGIRTGIGVSLAVHLTCPPLAIPN